MITTPSLGLGLVLLMLVVSVLLFIGLVFLVLVVSSFLSADVKTIPDPPAGAT